MREEENGGGLTRFNYDNILIALKVEFFSKMGSTSNYFLQNSSRLPSILRSGRDQTNYTGPREC